MKPSDSLYSGVTSKLQSLHHTSAGAMVAAEWCRRRCGAAAATEEAAPGVGAVYELLAWAESTGLAKAARSEIKVLLFE